MAIILKIIKKNLNRHRQIDLCKEVAKLSSFSLKILFKIIERSDQFKLSDLTIPNNIVYKKYGIVLIKFL